MESLTVRRCGLSATLLIVVIASVVAFRAAVRAQEPRIGFVLAMKGDWLFNGKPIEQPGIGLPANATITLAPRANFRSGEEWTITVVLLNNESIPRRCNSFQTCKDLQPIRLPASLTQSSLTERIHRAVMRLLSLNPERYVPAISRRPDDRLTKLRDGVVLLDNGKMHIGDWFRELDGGTFSLSVVYIGRDGESRSPVVLTFTWDPAGPSAIPAAGLRPGLHAVKVRASAASKTPATQEVWLLLSGPGQFEKHLAAYREHVELARQWQNTQANAVQTFLRVCLDQLATPVTPD